MFAAMLHVGEYRKDWHFTTTSRMEHLFPFEGKDLYNLSEEEMDAFFKYKESQVKT